MATIPAHNPMVPFLGSIPGGMRNGLMVRIKGHMHSMGQRFDVNLMCGPALNPLDDVAIHLSVRPDEMAIVRNDYQQGWAEEERYGGCPIYPGQQFEMLLLATHNCYKIAVNGLHHSEFVHRLPLTRVSFINITGDTSISFIGLEEDPASRSGTVPSAPMISASAPMLNSAGPTMPMPMAMPMAPAGQPPYMPQPSSMPYAPPPTYTPPSYQSYVPPNPHAPPPYNPQAAALSYGGNPSFPQQPYGGGMVTSVQTTPAYGAPGPQMLNQQYLPEKKKGSNMLKYAAAAGGIGAAGIGAYALSRAFGNSSDSD